MSGAENRFEFVPLDGKRSPEDAMRLSLDAFRQALATRRSVREFSSDAVPRDLVENAIRVAATAPSAANLQPWRFVLVSDPRIKKRIREAAEKEERINYEGGRLPENWLRRLEPLGTDWRKPFLEKAPFLIVVFRIDYVVQDAERLPNYYVHESVGLACGFLLAALHLGGLATLTHTPSPMGFLSKILGRPENEKPYLLIPVGYPARNAKVPVLTRKTEEEFLIRV